MMKVIHNLIVTSLASASAQKLHSRVRVLKKSTRKCARETLAYYETFTLECEHVRSTRTRECELALNLYHTYICMFTFTNGLHIKSKFLTLITYLKVKIAG